MTDEQAQRLAEWRAVPDWEREAVISTLLDAVSRVFLPEIEYATHCGLAERARYLRIVASNYVLAAQALGYVQPPQPPQGEAAP